MLAVAFDLNMRGVESGFVPPEIDSEIESSETANFGVRVLQKIDNFGQRHRKLFALVGALEALSIIDDAYGKQRTREAFLSLGTAKAAYVDTIDNPERRRANLELT